MSVKLDERGGMTAAGNRVQPVSTLNADQTKTQGLFLPKQVVGKWLVVPDHLRDVYVGRICLNFSNFPGR